MKTSKLALAAALIAVSLSLGAQLPAAGAAGLPSTALVQGVPGAATNVDWRWRRWGRGWGWRRPGIGLGIIGGVIIGSVLVANAVAEHRADDGAMRACARDFRGFDWRTGTFIDNRGQVRVCPYLQ